MSDIGDTNKMVDTPRTDDQECDMFVGVSTFTPSDIRQAFDFARQLERELNAAHESFRKLNIHALDLVDRIKRLEQAVKAYQHAYTPDGHVRPHDCFATGPRLGDRIEDLIVCPGCWAEKKAKESKP